MGKNGKPHFSFYKTEQMFGKKFFKNPLTSTGKCDIIKTVKERKRVKKMTTYEKDYTNRLNEMLDLVIRKYGFEAEETIYFATLIEKFLPCPNYQNREKMERVFKGLVK